MRTAMLAATILIFSPFANAATCESVKSLALPATTITLAEPVAAGAFTQAGGRGAQQFAGLPAFCRVAAALRPVTDSEIKIEVWVPAAGWNGKMQSVGNGAWAGSISFPAMGAAPAAGWGA